jgi:hypothetical protein
MDQRNRPDRSSGPDRGAGSTPPEQADEGENLVGRPAVERPTTAFHEATETLADEREPFDEQEALRDGGSFDGLPLTDASGAPGRKE